MSQPIRRRLPNILITGTPGTGKTTHSTQLLETLNGELPQVGENQEWETINVSEFVKAKKLHSGFNEEWDTWDVDEDKLLDELESVQSKGGKILDWHTCDIFPERWIDLVVVLRCDHTQLWSRLEKRGYAMNKIQENNEAEIMQVVLDEAREAYAEEIVVELRSQGPDDVEQNVARILSWVQGWLQTNPEGVNA